MRVRVDLPPSLLPDFGGKAFGMYLGAKRKVVLHNVAVGPVLWRITGNMKKMPRRVALWSGGSSPTPWPRGAGSSFEEL